MNEYKVGQEVQFATTGGRFGYIHMNWNKGVILKLMPKSALILWPGIAKQRVSYKYIKPLV